MRQHRPVFDFGLMLASLVAFGGVLFAGKRGNDDDGAASGSADEGESGNRVALEADEYRTLIEGLPLATFINTLDGTPLYVSPQVEQMLGYAPEYWVSGRVDLARLLHPDDRERVLAELQRAAERHAPFEAEYRLIAADGSVVWVHDETVVVYDEQGRPLYRHGYAKDITETREAEEALMWERSLLSIFLAQTPDAVYFKDSESRFLRVSHALAEKHGVGEADDVVGKTDFDYFSHENATFAREEELEIMRSGDPVLESDQIEEWEDGTVTYASVTKMPLRAENGQIIGTFGLSRDITQRKLAELALHAQAERLSRIIETQRDIAAADPDLQSVMDLICERTQELTSADGATILLLDGDDFVHSAATGFLRKNIGSHVPMDQSLTGWVYRMNESAICEDTQTDPRTNAKLTRKRGIRSMVVVPLRHGDEAVGVLEVLSQRPNAFTNDDLSTLELLSVVLSSALSHASEFEAKREQVEALARFRTVFEGASIGITRVGMDGRNAEVNPALEQMLGYSAAELARKSFRDYTHPDDVEANAKLFDEMMAGKCDSYTLEKRCFRKDGELIWVRVTAVVERDVFGEPAYTVAMIENITERKLAEEALRQQAELNEHQALHDALTGLPNRTLFHDRIQQAILAAEREGGRIAVMMMDLDRFKEINDTLGHLSGDALLEEVGSRIAGVLRASDTVARLGGDEFGVLLPKAADPAGVIQVVEKIREAVEQPIVLQDLPLGIEASIGVSFYPEDGLDVDMLLQRADIAMYTAKEDNASFAFYNAETHDYDPARLTLVGELRRAIDNHELVLYYQPKAVLASGAVGSVEALIRWQHPSRGLVPPDDFIPLAQQTGLMKPLTLYVIDEALEQCRVWQEEGIRLSVAVNLSTRNLLDVDFPDDVACLLDKWQVDHALLELEITESTMLADPFRTKVVLDKLAAMGVRLSIDDFGTGYSSLAYLKRLPVNEIKIDRSFVMNMNEDEDDAVIVRSTIDLGRNLGLEVVAEGVENEAIWNKLTSLGCDVAQGYYLSRPVPPDELATWIRGRAPQQLPRSTDEGGLAATAI